MARVTRAARRAEWADRLERFESAGLSVAAFCRNEDLSVASFYFWRRRLSAERTVAPSVATGFVAVQIAPPAGVVARQSTLVRLGPDVQIELGADLALAEMVVRELLHHTLGTSQSAGREAC